MRSWEGSRVLVGTCALLSFLIVGCGPGGTSSTDPISGGPGEVRAIVDEETLTAMLPLDDLVSQDETVQLLYFKSQVVRISRCVKSHGGSLIPNASVQGLQIVSQENRTHGQWDIDSAKKFGFEVDPDRGLPKLTSLPWRSEDLPRVSSCYKDLAHAAADVDDFYRASNSADRLRSEAISAARESEEGKAALVELQVCLREQNISSDASGQIDTKYFSQTQAEQIATATALARCNFEKRVPQRLFDLQAKNETALIADHQEELAVARKAKLAYIKKLETIVNAK